jgi:hypothetical protein
MRQKNEVFDDGQKPDRPDFDPRQGDRRIFSRRRQTSLFLVPKLSRAAERSLLVHFCAILA